MIPRLCNATVVTTLLAAAGCAYVEQRYKDVTADPTFAVTYPTGETYRLRADGQIRSVGGRLELWTPPLIAFHAGKRDSFRLVADVPAGSAVRVDGREHSYTFAFPPVPGDSQILHAYGTVETGTGRWTHVVLADDPQNAASFVPGTDVLYHPPDRTFLDPANPATR